MSEDRFDHALRRAARPAEPRDVDACLDADLLAAFAEGTLPSGERDLVDAHLADCARCLAVVAATVQTAPPAAEPQRTTWFSIRWVLPLATAAAAITAWVVVRDPRLPVAPATPQIARVEAPAVPPPLPSELAKSSTPEFKQEPQRKAEAVARSRSDSSAGAEKKEKAAPSERRQVAADTAAAAKPTEVDALTTQPQVATAPQPRPAPPPLSAPAPAAAAESVSAFRGAAGRGTLNAGVAVQIVPSPDPQIRWRFAGTVLERTIDGGATWGRASASVSAQLLAGAAPTPLVCWIVGHAGTVLLTTDGATWRRIPFPAADATLVAVTASDARAATVTVSDGRTYRTTDGGATWQLQENPAAPF